MLLLTILCDARKFCCPKVCCRINQRDIKLQYLMKSELASIAQMASLFSSDTVFIFLLQQIQHHCYQLDPYTVMKYAILCNRLKLIKFLIRRNYVEGNLEPWWEALFETNNNDSIVYTIIKTSLQKGMTLREIYGKDKDLIPLINSGFNIKTVKLMFKHGFNVANLQIRHKRNLTLLFFGVGLQHDCLEIFQYLFKQGVTLKNYKEDWRYVLTIAVAHGNLPILEFLFDKVGITFNDIPFIYKSSIEEAQKKKFSSVLQFLRRKQLLGGRLKANINYHPWFSVRLVLDTFVKYKKYLSWSQRCNDAPKRHLLTKRKG